MREMTACHSKVGRSPSGAEACDDLATRLQLDDFGIELLEGLSDVGCFDVLEIIATCGEDAVGHGGDDSIADELLYPTGITEVGGLRIDGLCDGPLQFLSGFRSEEILITFEETAGNLDQLLC